MRVVVVGGGVIGLATAWRLAREGLEVTVVDPAPGEGASHAAGGMLAPVTEVRYGETPLLDLCLASNRRWERFAAEVEADSGISVGYRREGTVAVGLNADDRRALRELEDYQRRLGLTVESLSGRACRRVEPMLSPEVTGGSLIAEDTSVDNRRLLDALTTACRRVGVELLRAAVDRIATTAGSVDGVHLTTGDPVPTRVVVLAAGVASPTIEGVPAGALAVRPVKGEILRLRAPAHLRSVLTRTVRAMVVGRPVYLVPREDGEVVIGATSYEQGFDTRVTAGGVHRLLDDARAVVPAIDDLELTESIARPRPGTPDNGPVIGELGVRGLVAATGHYRHGVLLTPVTADAVVDLVVHGRTDATVAAFGPDRFGPDVGTEIRTPREESAWT